MSDRFVLHAPKDEIESLFDVRSKREDYFEPDYNITPGTSVPIVIGREGDRKIRYAQWGMIPPDADAEKEGEKNYETSRIEIENDDWLEETFVERRCIIPANGFYKWKTGDKESTPFYIRLLSNELMGLAGLYAVWEAPSGRKVYSFLMLTTEANALVQPVDNRMPVILENDSYSLWLGEGEVEPGALSGLLEPYDLTRMAVNRVSEEVNDPDKNDPSLIQPIPK